MGIEENGYRYFGSAPFTTLGLIDRAEQERADEEAARNSRMRRNAAQADALRVMADMACPESVKEFGHIHNLPNFVEVCWLSAFEAGYAAGLVRLKERDTSAATTEGGPRDGE